MNNDRDLPEGDTPLSHEDREKLRKLLSMSYPQAKGSVKNGVLQQIARERSAKRMNRILRYGSIAACFVFLMGIAIGLIPKVNNAMESTEADAVSYYATTGRKDVSPEEPISPLDVSAPCENEKTSDEALSNTDDNYAPEVCTPSLEDSDYTADRISFPCDKHPNGMHIFPKELIDCVGSTAFNAWYNSTTAIDDCGLPSVRAFVRHFGISQEKLTEIGSACKISFPTELIYGKNN